MKTVAAPPPPPPTTKLSLWLVPPEPLLTRLQDDIDSLSSSSSSSIAAANAINGPAMGDPSRRNSNPSFLPHITLIGGVPCHPSSSSVGDSSGDVCDDGGEHSVLLSTFRSAFDSYGPIRCEFVRTSPLQNESLVDRLRVMGSGAVDYHRFYYDDEQQAKHDDDRGQRTNSHMDGAAADEEEAERREEKKDEYDGQRGSNGDGETKQSASTTANESIGPVFAVLEPQTLEVKWNQSCVCLVRRLPSLVNAAQMTQRVFDSFTSPSDVVNDEQEPHQQQQEEEEQPQREKEDEVQLFKPPLAEPHFSYAYGTVVLSPSSSSTSRLEPPDDFDCTELVLMKTDPANLNGVKQWSEVGRISLL